MALGSFPGPLTVAGARPVDHQPIRISIVKDASHQDRGGPATVGKCRNTDKSRRKDERKGSYQSCAAHARLSIGEANQCDEELSANPNQGRHSLPQKRTRSDRLTASYHPRAGSVKPPITSDPNLPADDATARLPPPP